MDMNLTLTMETIVAILGIVVTVLIAVIGGIYAIVTNTKKYELTENYRTELLQWYSSVVNLMISIIHYIEYGIFYSSEFSKQRTDMLSQLSSLIEVGRFYFPNVIKGDNFGSQKPSAYQGYRHINLEFMLRFYRIASDGSNDKTIPLLWRLERNFTAVIFDMIEPREALIKCVFGGLRKFCGIILLQFLEIHKVFRRNCAAFCRKIFPQSALADLISPSLERETMTMQNIWK